MPSSLSDGLPFVLCPDNLPVAFAAQFEDDTHHDHAGHHGDPGTAAVDHCDFGQMFSSVAPPLDDQPDATAVLAAPYHASVSRLIVGQARLTSRARGPPWQEQT